MWPPPIDDIGYFLSTFDPVLPVPTCWYHMMTLRNTTQNGRSVTTQMNLDWTVVLVDTERDAAAAAVVVGQCQCCAAS
jgi:hypothetical protein